MNLMFIQDVKKKARNFSVINNCIKNEHYYTYYILTNNYTVFVKRINFTFTRN